ncbi:T9SS C-terminal target domain-containing protein [Flavobacterium sp. PLA-1-15]|uniref:T9SS C-terminal target domain-containing protein n=1 Tax=Flavobacterium sp. PLA-1-15 TaxID=3380533 RepID=UPI003B7E5522
MRKAGLFLFIFISLSAKAQLSGCTDAMAKNYNPTAVLNDGSCVYENTKITPVFSITLSDTLNETSGLVYYDKQLWSHNDDTDTHIYALDTLGKITNRYPLKGVKNNDWEELSQDSAYFYMGNFGNNVSGIRNDLHILRIEKNSLKANDPQIDTIAFQYSNQIEFIRAKANTTDFDCEAFIVGKDSIYIFTKQWTSKKTALYALPKQPGNHTAQFKSELDTNGLITGATYLEDKKLIALCGYSKQLKPFVYLLYDYKENDFFSGNKRKINLALPYHQVEGIATQNGLQYYISNEYFRLKPIINTPQQLHLLDLNTLLQLYLNKENH